MAKDGSVIVIGGGISGLVAATRLAQQGRRVVLLEANDKVGGCNASTQIDGYTLHDGAVFLVMRSVLAAVFARLGLDLDALLRPRRVVAWSTTWLPDGSVVTHRDGTDVSVTGAPGFDADRTSSELQAYVARWRPLYRTLTEDLMMHPASAPRMLRATWRHLPLVLRSAAAELRRTITHPAVRSALAGSVLYSGVPASKAPSLGLLGLVAALVEGTWLPELGMGHITNVLEKALRRAGGEVILESPVERIILEGGKVRGVAVRGRGVVKSETVLSTVSALTTFGHLIEAGSLPSSLGRKIRRVRLSQRAVSVQLGLRNHLDVATYALNVLPHMDDQHQYFESGERTVPWLAWTVPTAVVPELAPRGGSIVELFPPIRQDLPPEAWDDQRKRRVMEGALETIARHHPLDVAVCRVRGPAEFERELHLPQGALYGLATDTSPLALFAHRSPIPGLYQAGQSTFPGYSVPASAASGLLAADAICGR